MGDLKMGYQQSIFDKCRDSLILLVPLALSTVSFAETYEFQLMFFDETPGIDEYRAGELDAAIEMLANREKTANNQYVGKELATLCGYYILKGNRDAARETCSAAIEIDPNGFAYNNRAVLRVQLGDTVGALEDFDRVRVLPDDQPRYIEQLKKDDERLIASRNFALATQLIERRRTNKPTMAGAIKGADVEDIIH
jgi:tetratricopeptide (TPR) repeat protein